MGTSRAYAQIPQPTRRMNMKRNIGDMIAPAVTGAMAEGISFQSRQKEAGRLKPRRPARANSKPNTYERRRSASKPNSPQPTRNTEDGSGTAVASIEKLS